ncbi:succinate dehydrogenase cytochrome b subunit [Desulfosediminicola ganghwensis]|uniref:succinate dehydrogenase cytochrome b subunit n=1 Tax=Desulfosediminicola ganghwensis TaxID=2569540 RepID=UPI0010AC144F|nr:succinate dehydrogenase cytochrome b subunit [Desulfosediminicola ganghwensis]
MWFINFFKTSIGRKYVMAITGLLLVLFLCTHVFGNVTIYLSASAFQHYADALHSLPVLVFIFSTSLFTVLAAHIGFGLYLFFQNREVNSSRYAVQAEIVTEKKSIAAKTMPYSGLLLLLFLLVHVSGFTLSGGEMPISELVKERFSGFFYSLFYLISFAAMALHLTHGFWSMLQTLGANHPRYNDAIDKLTYIVPAFFLIMFGGIPLYFMTGLGSNF